MFSYRLDQIKTNLMSSRFRYIQDVPDDRNSKFLAFYLKIMSIETASNKENKKFVFSKSLPASNSSKTPNSARNKNIAAKMRKFIS